MGSKKNKAVFFSMGGALVLSSAFLLITFFIFYQYAESLDVAKDALNTTGAFFGGIATLWAACVAAYLFNDWREQEKIIFVRNIAHETAHLIVEAMRLMQEYHRGEKLKEVQNLEAKIYTNLSFIKRQIKDDDLQMLSENIGILFTNFRTILKDNFNLDYSAQSIKQKINKNIKDFKYNYDYLATLTDIEKIYQKAKK